MDHMKLSDELRQQLLESAAWGKAGISVTQSKDSNRVDEETEQVDEGGPEEDQEQLEEEAVHVCPLCVSLLEEPIEEESILEHLNVVMGLVDRLSQINEDEEDVESVIDNALEDLLLPDTDEE
jgi:hypothetical protein